MQLICSPCLYVVLSKALTSNLCGTTAGFCYKFAVALVAVSSEINVYMDTKEPQPLSFWLSESVLPIDFFFWEWQQQLKKKVKMVLKYILCGRGSCIIVMTKSLLASLCFSILLEILAFPCNEQWQNVNMPGRTQLPPLPRELLRIAFELENQAILTTVLTFVITKFHMLYHDIWGLFCFIFCGIFFCLFLFFKFNWEHEVWFVAHAQRCIMTCILWSLPETPRYIYYIHLLLQLRGFEN